MVTKATNEKSTSLLSKLIELQQFESMTDYQFSNILGIKRAHWTMIRNGTRPIGLVLLRGVLRTYPELTPDVIEYLGDGGKE